MIFAFSLAVGFVCCAASSWVCAKARVPGGLPFGLILATAILGLLQGHLSGGILKPGPAVGPLALAAIPALAAALWGEHRRAPKSERNLAGLVFSGLLLGATGLGVSMVRDVEVSPATALALSVVWLVLVVGIAELISFIPAGLFAVSWLGASLVGLGVGFDTVGAAMLAGVLAGGVTGRAAAHASRGQEFPWDRGDVFAVGIWLAVATSASFLKGAAFLGLVLPLGLVIGMAALASLHAFERTLILRAAPGPGYRRDDAS